MKFNLVKILKFSGFLAVGIILLYFAFRDMDFESLKADFRSVRYSWVLLSLVFAFIAYISRTIRWTLIIEPLGYKPRFNHTFYSLMVGYLANFAFPRLGEVTRCASLSKKEKIPVDKLFGTVIVERAVDLLSLFILLLILVIFRFETFGSFFRENIFLPLGQKISNTLNISVYFYIGGFLLLAGMIVGYFIFREELSRFGIVVRIKNVVKGIIAGLQTVYKMKKRGAFIFHSVFIWFNYLMMTWVVVFALPSTSDLDIIDGMFLLVIGGLGMSAPVQGGIGAFHWIVSRGLFTVYKNVSLEEGLVFATISHESQSLMAIGLGTLSFFLLLRTGKQKTSN